MELIDKKELLRILRKQHKECQEDAEEMGGEAVLLEEGLSDAIDIITDIPTVQDVAPVVHGRWDAVGEYCNHAHEFKCTACGLSIFYDHYTRFCEYDYCPNCGAKMDGGDSDGLETP